MGLELRTKALTDCVPSEYFILVFVQPHLLLVSSHRKEREGVLWETKRGKDSENGRWWGWETTRGSLVVSKSFFLPEMLSADLITACGNSDTRCGRPGKNYVQDVDRGCNSLTQGRGTSKQKEKELAPRLHCRFGAFSSLCL